MSDSNDFTNFLAGFVIGGLVGAAVALLMAPQSGEATRATIREKSIELRDKAAETAEDARARAEKGIEEARIRLEQATVDLRSRTEELTRVTRERAAELQKRGQGILDEQRARIAKGKNVGEEPAAPAAE